MDGAWTGHPDQNEIAGRAVPYPNQIAKLPGCRIPSGPAANPKGGEAINTCRNADGAVRTVIRYRNGVSTEKEPASRWVHGRPGLPIASIADDRTARAAPSESARDDGKTLEHHPHFGDPLFDEELAKMQLDAGRDRRPSGSDTARSTAASRRN